MGRLLIICAGFVTGIAVAGACDGIRTQPSPTNDARPPPGNVADGNNNVGSGGDESGGANAGGAPAAGGGGAGAGGGGVGGNGPVTFDTCGCALETLDTENAACDQCKQLAEDDFQNDPCGVKLDACLTDMDCIDAIGPNGLPSCKDTPTLACAEAVLAGIGMATSSKLLLVDYFDCICESCSPECDPQGAGGGGTGGAGGAGGGPPGIETCIID